MKPVHTTKGLGQSPFTGDYLSKFTAHLILEYG